MENNSTDQPTESSPRLRRRIYLIGLFVLMFIIGLVLVQEYLDLKFLAQQESALKETLSKHPWLTYGIAFLIYVTVTGLSLPGALLMSLIFAWFFGFLPTVVLVSFASTTGATIAFLLSRYLFREAVQQRFAAHLVQFNKALDNEGAFYLFTLRLIPAVPFFVINAVMGLTRMSVVTFWWVSQLGMLAGTMVFVYAGSQVPDLQTLDEQGIHAVLSTEQLTRITIALALLGLFPISVKKLVVWIQRR